MSESLVSGVLNFRDTGGLRAGDAVTRGGVLFRSGALASADDAGLRALAHLRLRRVVDLRADDELRWAPSPPTDAQVMRVPLFTGAVDSFFQEGLTLPDMYRAIVSDSAPRVVEVVRAVLADQPVLVHCTAGKDRTGVTVALTLAAAGVDEDDIVTDYARTEHLLPVERNRSVIAYLRRVMPEATTTEELVTRSPAPVMRGLLDELRQGFGAPVEFLRAHGLADDEIAELQRVLIQRA